MKQQEIYDRLKKIMYRIDTEINNCLIMFDGTKNQIYLYHKKNIEVLKAQVVSLINDIHKGGKVKGSF